MIEVNLSCDWPRKSAEFPVDLSSGDLLCIERFWIIFCLESNANNVGKSNLSFRSSTPDICHLSAIDTKRWSVVEGANVPVMASVTSSGSKIDLIQTSPSDKIWHLRKKIKTVETACCIQNKRGSKETEESLCYLQFMFKNRFFVKLRILNTLKFFKCSYNFLFLIIWDAFSFYVLKQSALEVKKSFSIFLWKFLIKSVFCSF